MKGETGEEKKQTNGWTKGQTDRQVARYLHTSIQIYMYCIYIIYYIYTYIKWKNLEMGSSPKKYIEYADMPYMLRLLRHIDK